jgi:hypothetical protein
MPGIFQKVWDKLGAINHTLFPTQAEVIRSALFKASPSLIHWGVIAHT